MLIPENRGKHPLFVWPNRLELGYSVNVPQNKMAYEVIMVYHLRMPFFIAIFLCFLKKSIRQDMTFRKKSDDLF